MLAALDSALVLSGYLRARDAYVIGGYGMDPHAHHPADDCPSTLDVPGVGAFAYDGVGVDYRHYVRMVDVGGPEPAMAIAYVHRSQRGFAEGYPTYIRRVLQHVVPGHRRMLRDTRDKVQKLMDSYGLEMPIDYETLVHALHLSHIKPFQDGTCELIFASCPWFPNFDLNASLDDQLAIQRVWFGG